MPSHDSRAMRSQYHPERGGLARSFFSTVQHGSDRAIVLGLALWIAGVMTGCGGEGGTTVATPEQKQKQEVVQNKMKDFMQKSKLPNKPR
jgi:hypothetical protein